MTVTTVTGETVLLYWILKPKIGYCYYSNWQPSWRELEWSQRSFAFA
jgi:hypothetical protein